MALGVPAKKKQTQIACVFKMLGIARSPLVEQTWRLWLMGDVVRLIFNPHQRCGYSDSPFARKDTFLKGWTSGGADTKRKLILRKRHFFTIEKYIEDVKQDEKHVPDLLESIMSPACLVKEELQPGRKSKNSGLQILDSRTPMFSCWRPMPAFHSTSRF